MDGDGFQRVIDRDALLGAQLHPVFGHPVDGTPHGFHHVAGDHRGVLVEGEGHPQIHGGLGGGDGGGPAGSQILQVDVPPVVDVGHEEGGGEPQRLGLGQLVHSNQLGVDDDRPHVPEIWVGLGHLDPHVQVLLGGGVPVAVGQNLHPLLGGQGEGLFHLLIGHGGVAPVLALPLVGGAQPGGAALGGAVQKDFHAPQPQPVVVAGYTVREGHPGGVEVGHPGIAHHVQGQGVLG